MSGPVPTASDAGWMADVSFVIVMETSPNIPPGDAALSMMSLPSASPDAEKATQVAVEEAALPATTSEAFRRSKGQVSD